MTQIMKKKVTKNSKCTISTWNMLQRHQENWIWKWSSSDLTVVFVFLKWFCGQKRYCTLKIASFGQNWKRLFSPSLYFLSVFVQYYIIYSSFYNIKEYRRYFTTLSRSYRMIKTPFNIWELLRANSTESIHILLKMMHSYFFNEVLKLRLLPLPYHLYCGN